MATLRLALVGVALLGITSSAWAQEETAPSPSDIVGQEDQAVQKQPAQKQAVQKGTIRRACKSASKTKPSKKTMFKTESKVVCLPGPCGRYRTRVTKHLLMKD
jgi:hypothetical protein